MHSFLIACDKFKGTLSSLAVGQALARGLQKAYPDAQIRVRPASDGGEGFLEAIQFALPLTCLPVYTVDPCGLPIQAQLGWEAQRRRVWLESAQAVGLHRVPSAQRHPLQLNSYGLGLLLRAALQLKPADIWIGLGSSGTVDGGMGMAQALGWQLLDASGRLLPLKPACLPQLAQLVPPHTRLPLPPVKALCDVRNPLLGETGGVRIYSRQKGALPHEVLALEQALQHWAQQLAQALACPLEALVNQPGAGAAGGLGFACAALLQAELLSGAAQVMRETGLLADLRWADWVITGEGAYDHQSNWGKWPQQLIAAAQAQEKPVLLVTGQPLAAQLPEGVVAALDVLSLDPCCAQSASRSQEALEVLASQLIPRCIGLRDRT